MTETTLRAGKATAANVDLMTVYRAIRLMESGSADDRDVFILAERFARAGEAGAKRRESVPVSIAELTEAFGDASFGIREMTRCGEQIISRVTFRGRQRRAFDAVLDLGRAVEADCVLAHTLRDGAITHVSGTLRWL